VPAPDVVEALDVLCRKAVLALCRFGHEWPVDQLSLHNVETNLSAIELS
jgi:hypothetical protein